MKIFLKVSGGGVLFSETPCTFVIVLVKYDYYTEIVILLLKWLFYTEIVILLLKWLFYTEIVILLLKWLFYTEMVNLLLTAVNVICSAIYVHKT